MGRKFVDVAQKARGRTTIRMEYEVIPYFAGEPQFGVIHGAPLSRPASVDCVAPPQSSHGTQDGHGVVACRCMAIMLQHNVVQASKHHAYR